jgi:AcrR family transcriptional regulator
MRNNRNDLESMPDPTEVSGNELAKSRGTRRRIMEAGRDLLAAEGYARFSTGAVAERARLTRPAMLYHFGSRAELLDAVTRFVVRRRIELFEEAVRAVPLTDSYKGQQFRAVATALAWEHLDLPEFWAFTELVMAARTNPELAEIVQPAVTIFDRSRRELTTQVFPSHAYDMADFNLARDVVRFLSEGAIAQNTMVEDRDARIADLKHFLQMLVATTDGNQFLEAVVRNRKPQPPAEPQPTEPPSD